MNKQRIGLSIFFLLILFLLFAVFNTSHFDIEIEQPTPELNTIDALRRYDSQAIRPLPRQVLLPANKVALGETLFHDPILSKDNTISCSSCHLLTLGGADGKDRSVGINGTIGMVNAPTVFNSSYNFAQFWDGRADTLAQQVSGPVHNPAEMASSWPQVMVKMQDNALYIEKFQSIYADGITTDNIIDAIVHYERSLITPDSAFDNYLRGEQNALNERELRGYELFKEYGCISCHQGINIGGNMFQQFGVVKNYFKNKVVKPADLGRFNVTNRDEDRHVFKVPSLRNIALTAPYFHNGSVKTLPDAIKIMGEYQLGQQLSDTDVSDIAAFLNTLTGKLEGKSLQ